MFRTLFKAIAVISAALLTILGTVLPAQASSAAAIPAAVRATEESDPNKSPALCGTADTPEQGIQGDTRPAGGVNCGLTFLSEVPGGGSVQGAGHCGYVRTGNQIRAFDLTDPANPEQTDSEATRGTSETMRTRVTDERAILVSGNGVWDISNCEDLAFIGDIPWPGPATGSQFSHEIAISQDGHRVYGSTGFVIADISDLGHPETWTVKDHTCRAGKQAGFPLHQGPDLCQLMEPTPVQVNMPQYAHSSADNAAGTRWYGSNQRATAGSESQPTARVFDLTDPEGPKLLDSLEGLPGHSMDYWKVADGREFIVGANELGTGDTCQEHPRDTNLGTAADAYVAEVTGDEMVHASRVSLMINEPQNCEARAASGSSAQLSEHSMYNKQGAATCRARPLRSRSGRSSKCTARSTAALLMLDFGDAGLRVFDVRDGYAPKEVAYFNTSGHVHSGLFHYDDARGLMLQSASSGMRVLELQPQVIAAAGLPYPTDPAYPRYPNGRPATP